METVNPSQSNTSASSLALIQKSNIISFNQPISVKLNEKNFDLWKQQVLSAICAYELKKFIARPKLWPAKYNSVEKEMAEEVSEEFKTWKKQDQLLMSWLLSSMTENMLTRAVGCEKSYIRIRSGKRYKNSLLHRNELRFGNMRLNFAIPRRERRQ